MLTVGVTQEGFLEKGRKSREVGPWAESMRTWGAGGSHQHQASWDTFCHQMRTVMTGLLSARTGRL